MYSPPHRQGRRPRRPGAVRCLPLLLLLLLLLLLRPAACRQHGAPTHAPPQRRLVLHPPPSTTVLESEHWPRGEPEFTLVLDQAVLRSAARGGGVPSGHDNDDGGDNDGDRDDDDNLLRVCFSCVRRLSSDRDHDHDRDHDDAGNDGPNNLSEQHRARGFLGCVRPSDGYMLRSGDVEFGVTPSASESFRQQPAAAVSRGLTLYNVRVWLTDAASVAADAYGTASWHAARPVWRQDLPLWVANAFIYADVPRRHRRVHHHRRRQRQDATPSSSSSSSSSLLLLPRFVVTDPPAQVWEYAAPGHPVRENVQVELRVQGRIELQPVVRHAAGGGNGRGKVTTGGTTTTDATAVRRSFTLCVHDMTRSAPVFCQQTQASPAPSSSVSSSNNLLPVVHFAYDITVELGTHVLSLTLDGVPSPPLIVDVVPDGAHHPRFPPQPPTPLPTVRAPSRRANDDDKNNNHNDNDNNNPADADAAIRVLILGAVSIGGQQVLDSRKAALLARAPFHITFLSETAIAAADSAAHNTNNGASLRAHYVSLSRNVFKSGRFALHDLPRVLGSAAARAFLAEKWQPLAHVADGAQLAVTHPRLHARVAPLLHILEKVDVLSLPNSQCDPKLFNMLQLARLAGVRARVLELPNAKLFPQEMGAATHLVAPSDFVRLHPDAGAGLPVVAFLDPRAPHAAPATTATRLGRRPCVVIPPVAIEPLPATPLRTPSTTTTTTATETPNVVTFAFLGRVAAERSPGLFLRAATKLHARTLRKQQQQQEGGSTRPAVRFVFIGPIKDRVRRAFHEVGITAPAMAAVLDDAEVDGSGTAHRYSASPSVDMRFLGPVPHTGIREMMLNEGVDVLVNSRSMETFGISIVEAMSVGICPVACAGGGHDEIVTHEVDGLLVNCVGRESATAAAAAAAAALGTQTATVAEALADAMERLVEDQALRSRLAEEARRTAVSRFSSERLVERYTALYARLAKDFGRERRGVEDEAAWAAAVMEQRRMLLGQPEYHEDLCT